MLPDAAPPPTRGLQTPDADGGVPSAASVLVPRLGQNPWGSPTCCSWPTPPTGVPRRPGAPARSATPVFRPYSAAVSALTEDEEIRERLRDHALFVGFAPADDPKIAVAVIVENGGSGSGAAAPVARALFDAWLEEFPAEQAEPVISDSRAAGGDN